MSPLLPPQFLALTPGNLEPGQSFSSDSGDLLQRVRAACSAGLSGLLLREPLLPDRLFLELARSLKAILGSGWLGLHDRAHLVAPAEAQAVHLGFRSITAGQARSCVGPEVAVGMSTHDGDERVAWNSADYLFHGPVFAPLSKSDHLPPVGTDGLQRFVRSAGIPTWGLGGITPDLAPAACATGARGVACLGGWLQTDDPAAKCRAYLEALAL